jgi:hypothetical protein
MAPWYICCVLLTDHQATSHAAVQGLAKMNRRLASCLCQHCRLCMCSSFYTPVPGIATFFRFARKSSANVAAR